MDGELEVGRELGGAGQAPPPPPGQPAANPALAEPTSRPSTPVRTDPLGAAAPAIDGIELIGRVGSGGMAEAFLGWDGAQWVVVKAPVPPVSDDTRARLRREVETMHDPGGR